MKLCQFNLSSDFKDENRLGILLDNSTVLDTNLCWSKHYQKNGFYNFKNRAQHHAPASLSEILNLKENPLDFFKLTLDIYEQLKRLGDHNEIVFNQFKLNCPIDKISTYRDFYAHEKHVAKGFEKRNEKVPEAWYEIPAYYKGATNGFYGHDHEIIWPYYSDKLDYELELAVIIGKDGKDIKQEKAIDHVLGFTILNDISARDIQKKEMAVRLGPAKGKDFCSILGPVIVTMDEFQNKEPDLRMLARINGEEWSRGQSGDSHYSFSQMIAHASMEEWLLAGDVIGSGTVGTGCGLELDKWIQPGDIIELEVEKIGILRNKVGQKTKRA